MTENSRSSAAEVGAGLPLGPLRAVANKCANSSCPTVYESSRPGVVVVQGYAVTAAQAGMDVPEGELLVEVPAALLAEAVRNLS